MSFVNQWKQRPLQLFPTACKVCPYGVSGRCNGPTTFESIHRRDIHVIGCHDPKRIAQHFRDTHSRHYPTPQTANQEKILLPAFIPAVTDGLPSPLQCNLRSLFAVSLGNILNEQGDLKVESPDELRRFFKLPADARIVLIGTGNDYLIERFWEITNSRNLWKRIARLGFEFVTSCTFSVWDKQPRFDQIINQDRNFISHDAFVREGIPTIPFLFFYDKTDYQNVIDWLKNRPYINKVAILAQCRQRNDIEFSKILEEMRSISNEVKRDLEFLVVGPSTETRISATLAEFNSTIVTSKPFYTALHGERTLLNLKHEKELNYKISRVQLALDNITTYKIICEEKKGKCNSLKSSVNSFPKSSSIQLSMNW